MVGGAREIQVVDAPLDTVRLEPFAEVGSVLHVQRHVAVDHEREVWAWATRCAGWPVVSSKRQQRWPLNGRHTEHPTTKRSLGAART